MGACERGRSRFVPIGGGGDEEPARVYVRYRAPSWII